ncbi:MULTISPECIES: DUF3077 domain-containing protein [Pseudomonas]|uniref:DUF3077 domain-containing protein n=1 Tax=Pseudomonas sp. Hg7Tf TaxID=3236988 RepID=A0AB39HYJ8_9PSED|nr:MULTISPECIES: DUF3077 domain-containing protein [Pseudomonas]MDD1975964.1 DUF3077 domain-containing protein [Pseudomonas putida]MDH2560464.1 DUF3077 domain-containing protein [Pseudomonas sp. Hg5Tf]
MKKSVPDPPDLPFVETIERPVTSCPEHPPLFSVCAGISAEDALVHASLYLKCASVNIEQVVQYTREPGRSYAWSTQHSVEFARALIDALIDGIELQRVPT